MAVIDSISAEGELAALGAPRPFGDVLRERQADPADPVEFPASGQFPASENPAQ